jgi:hypothetical protein
MAVKTGRITLDVTGIIPYDLDFQPTWMQFECVSDDSWSKGNADGVRQNVLSKFNNGTVRASSNINTHVVNLTKMVSGSVVPHVKASFDSFTADGVKLNVVNADASIKVNLTFGN